MKPNLRAELLRVLDEFGKHYPDWRFGQLVANVAGMADVDLWDIEDEQLLDAAVAHLRRRFPSDVVEEIAVPTNS